MGGPVYAAQASKANLAACLLRFLRWRLLVDKTI
jgi:hypothetical protein